MIKKKKGYRVLINVCLTLLVVVLFFSAPSTAQNDLTGMEIMTKVDERDDGDDQRSSAIFQLTNKRGQKRIRDTIRLWKDYNGKNGLDAKMITFFNSPPDIKGTGFLSWSYWDDNKDDDQWLYLPALRKVRRISSSNKGDHFMGTDFTYDDMGERKIEEDNHTLLKNDNYNDTICYVVESISKKKKYIYSKKITWVDKQNWIPLKVDYFDRKGKALKTLNIKWKLVDNIWTWGKAEMANHQTGHKTIIEIKDIKINTGIEDGILMERTLKRGLR